ncbi:MAG TPA: enolase [Caldilineae bacterium]|nr:enolase [Caldilineae bacterium]
MKIVDVTTQVFTYTSKIVYDADGHAHPGPEHEATQSLLRIITDEGVEGYCFGADPEPIQRIVKPMLIGEDPFHRERIWQRLKERQRLHLGLLSDRVLAAVDMALWDLAGRYLNQPVYKLLGAYREKVKAYASTMCGDELEGGLNTPEAYADFAEQCKERGYKAFKLHTWMPPIPWAPDPKMDVAACRAVRERVGDDMVLMLDPYHYYSREEALYIGRELEKLGFYWFEEPMDEHGISSYVWLAEQLDIPIVGPETAEGKMYTRAEWIVRGASDISRGGVWDVGGITPLMKIVHLCESFGVRMEVHGGGAGNLHVLCAMGIPGEYYERGLLHPFLDYEEPPPWLHEIVDPMDDEGYVHVSQRPGLGLNINFDYIEAHTIAKV